MKFVIWTKWYGYVGENVNFSNRQDAYDFLVDYIGSQDEVEEMLEEGLACIEQCSDGTFEEVV